MEKEGTLEELFYAIPPRRVWVGRMAGVFFFSVVLFAAFSFSALFTPLSLFKKAVSSEFFSFFVNFYIFVLFILTLVCLYFSFLPKYHPRLDILLRAGLASWFFLFAFGLISSLWFTSQAGIWIGHVFEMEAFSIACAFLLKHVESGLMVSFFYVLILLLTSLQNMIVYSQKYIYEIYAASFFFVNEGALVFAIWLVFLVRVFFYG